jgi:hypothetical protein
MSPAYKAKINATLMTMTVLVGGVTMMANTYQDTASNTPDVTPTVMPPPTPTVHKQKAKIAPAISAPVHAKSGGSK